MSNRKLSQASFAAKLKAAHLAQIEALLDEGLSENAKVRTFGRAAGFTREQMIFAEAYLLKDRATAAAAVWAIGDAKLSLFAYVDGCGCPVQCQERYGNLNPLIPNDVELFWRPARNVLEEFAREQQNRRI